jgi:hypothetical protein
MGDKSKYGKASLIQNPQEQNTIQHLFLSTLLQPKTFINVLDASKFMFKPEHIVMLCDHAESFIREQPMVLRGSVYP